MQKIEFVYRELLFQALEKGQRSFTQKGLAEQLGISLTNVNHAIKPLKRMGAVAVKPLMTEIVNPKKILYYWASIRNLQRDILYSTRVEKPVSEIEKTATADSIYTAYSGYRLKFKDAPADYSEVYVYSDDVVEMQRRFPKSKNTPNLFVLKKDPLMGKSGKTATIANLFVDLWNLPEWYAKDFLKALEAKIHAILE